MKFRFYYTLLFSLMVSFAFGQEKLTMEEAVLGQYGKFAPERLEQLQWIKNTENYMWVKDNEVWVSGVNAKSKTTKLIDLAELNLLKGGVELKRIPRLNWLSPTTCYFETSDGVFEYNTVQKAISKMFDSDKGAENTDYHASSRQMAYTKDNNLYIQSKIGEIQITENGKDVVSGQGISRSEYGISKGTFWNESGSRLAFYQKDESRVSNYPLINYEVKPAAVREIKYPFSGMPSEYVSVGVYDVVLKKTVFLRPSHSEADQFYLTNLSWSPDNRTIYIAWLNRKTTDMRLISFDSSTGEELKVLFSEHDDKWVEPEHPAVFSSSKKNQFIWISNRDGFKNAYLYSTNGQLIGQTKFKFDITEILGFDAKNENVFVMATGVNPINQVCYRISLKNMNATLMTTENGVHSVQVATSGNFLIDSYSNPAIPYKIDLVDVKGKRVKNLLNAPNPYTNKLIGTTELFAIQSKDGTDLWCRLIKPTNFDKNKKYPVVVYVYNGPHVQLVTNNFFGGASLWMNYLAEQGYLVFTLDGHGSANRGREFEQVIHRNLGTREIEDQITGVEWLKSQSYVDEKRMAVHGWSYGGFMTTSLMLREPGVFKVGVAGGPVIDWSLYEVMYCERYMDTPEENPEGYEKSNLTNYVKNLEGDLLMIHGVDDDVVVMQHNMRFLKACVDNNIQVDFFAYPGHEHNVRGRDRVHLLTKIIDYITERL